MIHRLAAVARGMAAGGTLAVLGRLGEPVVRPGVVELCAVLTGRAGTRVPFDRLLLDLVSGAALVGYLGVLGSVALAAMAASTPGRRVGRLRAGPGRGVVVRWLALVAGACGIGISITPVGSLAAGGQGAHHRDPPTLTGLPMPGLPAVPRRPAATAPRHSATVIVRPGDTLWQIAADRLPGQATDARVAVAVNRWYRRNRCVVGPDPDLILPGTRLDQPGGTR